MLEVFRYPGCSTCRKALKWLDAHGVEYHVSNIVEQPPSLSRLKQVLSLSGLPVAKLFNTSGQSYRQGGFKEKLATMSDAQALEELARDGKLVKRPLVLGDGFVLVGFKEPEFARRWG